jgi:hypothetical protein
LPTTELAESELFKTELADTELDGFGKNSQALEIAKKPVIF